MAAAHCPGPGGDPSALLSSTDSPLPPLLHRPWPGTPSMATSSASSDTEVGPPGLVATHAAFRVPPTPTMAHRQALARSVSVSLSELTTPSPSPPQGPHRQSAQPCSPGSLQSLLTPTVWGPSSRQYTATLLGPPWTRGPSAAASRVGRPSVLQAPAARRSAAHRHGSPPPIPHFYPGQSCLPTVPPGALSPTPHTRGPCRCLPACHAPPHSTHTARPPGTPSHPPSVSAPTP